MSYYSRHGHWYDGLNVPVYCQDRNCHLCYSKKKETKVPSRTELKAAVERYSTLAIEAAAKLQELEGRVQLADLDKDTVIRFDKTFPSGTRVYWYAAIKADDGIWYTTGTKRQIGYTDEAMESFVGDNAIFVCTELTPLQDVEVTE
jgi:hypothetical protein